MTYREAWGICTMPWQERQTLPPERMEEAMRILKQHHCATVRCTRERVEETLVEIREMRHANK